MENNQKRKLVLIRGGLGMEGPITRMGLWERFPQTPPTTIAVLVGSKLLVLGALAYWLYA